MAEVSSRWAVWSFVVHLDVSQLGLAIGICGWLVARLSQQQLIPTGRRADREVTTQQFITPAFEVPWEIIGIILLLLGWLVSVVSHIPWQATAVSGLGLWICIQRLQRLWQRAELAALLGIGLQTIWLVWRLVPQPMQEWAITISTKLTGAENFPWALLSLALFPYLILIVWLVNWLDRASQPALANFAQQLALGFGAVLTIQPQEGPHYSDERQESRKGV